MGYEYQKIGLKNFIVLEFEKMKFDCEDRYEDYLKHIMLDMITSRTNEKIIEKISNMLADRFIERIKIKE